MVFEICGLGIRRDRCVNQWRLAGRVVAQGSDCIKQFTAVAQRGDAKLLEVLGRQVSQDRLVYFILADAASYFPRPRPRSQTTMSIWPPKLRVAALELLRTAGLIAVEERRARRLS